MDSHSLDSIKNTMQIQEDIFKRQVQELHRLYSVQKRLMGELNRESKNQLINNTTRNWSSSSSEININNSRNIIINHATSTPTPTPTATTTQQTNTGGGYILHFQNAIDHQDAIRERSGSCSGENIMKMGRGGGFDLERPAVLSAAANIEDEEQEQVNNAVGPSNKMSIDDEEEVELTLSIGVSSTNSNKKKKKSKSYQLGRIAIDSSSSAAAAANSNKSDHHHHRHHHGGGEDCSSPMSSSSTSATFDQDKKMPHWLFGLSINRT